MKQRKNHLDFIKVISVFFVIINHSYTYKLFFIHPDRLYTPLLILISGVCKTAVPLFFMVSGALLLNREEPIEKVYKQRIPKFLFTLLFLSVFMIIIRTLIYSRDLVKLQTAILSIISQPIIEPYWFMYAYLSFLFTLPFLRKMVKNMDDKEFKYFFTTSFFISLLISVLSIFLNVKIFFKADFTLFISTTFLFPILGYYLEKNISEFIDNKKLKTYINYSFVLWSIASVLLTFYVLKHNDSGDFTEKSMSFMIIIPSVFIFVNAYIFSQRMKRKSFNTVLTFLSNSVFTIFIFETLMKEQLFPMYASIVPGLPLFLHPILFDVLVFISCVLIYSILIRIPIFKKIL